MSVLPRIVSVKPSATPANTAVAAMFAAGPPARSSSSSGKPLMLAASLATGFYKVICGAATVGAVVSFGNEVGCETIDRDILRVRSAARWRQARTLTLTSSRGPIRAS
jgi:hypothetical protein